MFKIFLFTHVASIVIYDAVPAQLKIFIHLNLFLIFTMIELNFYQANIKYRDQGHKQNRYIVVLNLIQGK